MNWIERYVAEVRRYLPAEMREDVGEELQSLLEDERLAREADRERTLESGEMQALLREFGHPIRVAARYGSACVLISKILFPLYRKVVHYFLLAVLTVYLLALAWNLIGDITWGVMANSGSVPRGPGFEAMWAFAVNWLVLITVGFHRLLEGRSRTA